MSQPRSEFRQQVFQRDNHTCLVPSCDEDAVDAHHIMERSLWSDGGYIPENGASVCETHHKLAETNVIPPQAFYRWIDVEDPPLPDGVSYHSNKWGEEFEKPPWKEYREDIKYPSSRHLPWSHEQDRDDTSHQTLDWAAEIPLVATVKMDGGNCMIVKDKDNPIRARNGKHADKEHFDLAKSWYWNSGLYEEMDPNLQLFGEWLYAKHSIHYGCNCDESCEDEGPPLRHYFQLFGIYDKQFDVWLGWEKTVEIADDLGLELVPPAQESEYYITTSGEGTQKLWADLYDLSQTVESQGHEGIVVRSALPFHYGQFGSRLGKYVREDHVKDEEKHWSHRPLVQNQVRDDLSFNW